MPPLKEIQDSGIKWGLGTDAFEVNQFRPFQTLYWAVTGKMVGGTVVNTTNSNKERIGRILQMHANHREDVDAVFTGDIAAGIGFKNTRTGDTLSAPGAEIQLEQLVFPEPVIHVAVEPKTIPSSEKPRPQVLLLVERRYSSWLPSGLNRTTPLPPAPNFRWPSPDVTSPLL